MERACAFEALQHAGLVALRLEAADDPRARVCEAFVVEIDRVLRREDDPEPEGASLLQQHEERPLRRRHRDRWEVADHFVHEEERAERGRARLRTHPREHLPEEQRHEEHPLRIAEVRDRENGDPRFSFFRPKKAADVERRPVEPRVEPGRREERVVRDRELEALFLREERLEAEDAELVERRVLNAQHEPGEVEVLALGPRVMEDRRDEDVLAALARLRADADEAEEARRDLRDALAQRLRVRCAPPAAARRASPRSRSDAPRVSPA